MKKALMILLLAFPFISINKFHADEVVENNKISTYGITTGKTFLSADPTMVSIQDLLVPGNKEATLNNAKKLVKRDIIELLSTIDGEIQGYVVYELVDYDRNATIVNADKLYDEILNLKTPDSIDVPIKCNYIAENGSTSDTVVYYETIVVYDQKDPNTKFLNTQVDLVDVHFGAKFSSPVLYKINEKKRFDINKNFSLDLMKLKLAPFSAYGNTEQGSKYLDPVDNVNYNERQFDNFDNYDTIIKDNVVSWKLIKGEEIIKAKKPGVYTLTYQMVPITELGYNETALYLAPTFPENTEFPTVDVEVEFYDGNSTGDDQANNSDSVNTETKPTETVTYPEANKQNNVKQQKEKVATSDINNLFVMLPVVIISCLILYIRRKYKEVINDKNRYK